MDTLPKGPSPFRTSEAREAGISARKLRAMLNAGELIGLGRGLYMLADSGADPDLAEVTVRAPQATLCLATALAHHGLVDDIPTVLDLAQPRDSYRPRTAAPVAWHEFAPETFDVGRMTETIRGVAIPIYSAERSIADAFRLRGYEGYEIATRALRAWLATPGARPASVLSIARQLPRSERPLRVALETLI